MSERKAFLEKIHIKNFLSLRNVTLPFKPLTVLVGPNASGKSNVISALKLLKDIMVSETPPQTRFLHEFLWSGEAEHITYQLQTLLGKFCAEYQLVLSTEIYDPIFTEELSVQDINILSIRSGKGQICDEDGTNHISYKSNKLALQSAGSYGNKPITSKLTAFIKNWDFLDFEPEGGLRYLIGLEQKEYNEFLKFDDELSALSKVLWPTHGYGLGRNLLYGYTLSWLLSYWHKNAPERSHNVNESFEASTNLRIQLREIENESEMLYVLDQNDVQIRLDQTSQGTIRLLVYYILVNLPELPSLIAIEEPERNLHPSALKDIANVLEKLAERTQVIITTHSSQLLDAFSPDTLSDSLGVLLLRNRSGLGTEVINLEEIKDKREALDGWIGDFGIGSAIFDSELLQDLMEEPV